MRVRTAFCPGNRLNVEGGVDEGEFSFRGEAGLNEGKVAEFPRDEVMDNEQPIRAFGMAFTGIVFQVSDVFDDRSR